MRKFIQMDEKELNENQKDHYNPRKGDSGRGWTSNLDGSPLKSSIQK